MEHITASEAAGLGVGTLLLCATITAPKLDSFISSSQRRSLGMCRRCGDVKLIACSDCRGAGFTRSGGLFGFYPIEDLFPGLASDLNSNTKSLPCRKCKSRGHFLCPECSKSTPSSSA